MLTELFTLGVEDDVADNSEDDHSGLALTAAATVEATRAGNSSGQDENAPDQAAARSSGTHLLETIRVWIRVSVLERRVQVSAFSAIKQTAFRTVHACNLLYSIMVVQSMQLSCTYAAIVQLICAPLQHRPDYQQPEVWRLVRRQAATAAVRSPRRPKLWKLSFAR